MAKLKDSPSSPVAALLGDIRRSRHHPDRAELHRRVGSALAAAAGQVPALAAPRVTVGDEFQARYATVGEALEAGWRIRLLLLPQVDVRIGVGWGCVAPLDDRVEDGPGWWAAREAVEAAEHAEGRPGTRLVRTAYRRAIGVPGPDPAPVDAALVCRDHLVGSLDDRSLRLLTGLVTGMTKTELAAREGISPSAVSQRTLRSGIDAALTAQALLREVR